MNQLSFGDKSTIETPDNEVHVFSYCYELIAGDVREHKTTATD